LILNLVAIHHVSSAIQIIKKYRSQPFVLSIFPSHRIRTCMCMCLCVYAR